MLTCFSVFFLTMYVPTYLPIWASQVALVVKSLPANAGDIRNTSSISGLRRYPGEGTGYPLQYSCLENPVDRGDWWAAVHRFAELDMTEANKHSRAHLSACAKWHFPYIIQPLAYTSLGCRSKVWWGSTWVEHDFHHRARLIKLRESY